MKYGLHLTVCLCYQPSNSIAHPLHAALMSLQSRAASLHLGEAVVAQLTAVSSTPSAYRKGDEWKREDNAHVFCSQDASDVLFHCHQGRHWEEKYSVQQKSSR